MRAQFTPMSSLLRTLVGVACLAVVTGKTLVDAQEGIAIGIAIDVVRVETFFVPDGGANSSSSPSQAPTQPYPTPTENSTHFAYTEDGGSNGPGESGSWTILKQYVAHNETIRVISGTPDYLVPDSGVRGQLVDVGALCSTPNISFPSPLGFRYIPVIYHLDDAHLNTYTSQHLSTCTLETKLALLSKLLNSSSNVATNNGTGLGIGAAIFISPSLTQNASSAVYQPAVLPDLWSKMGIAGWLMEERSGLALIDLIQRNTRAPTINMTMRRREESGILKQRQDGTTVVLATLFGPNSPVYTLAPTGNSYNPYRQPFLISLVVVLIVLVVGLAWFFWRGARRGYWGLSRRPNFDLNNGHGNKVEVLDEQELEELPTRVFGGGRARESADAAANEDEDLGKVVPNSPSAATLCDAEEIDLGASPTSTVPSSSSTSVAPTPLPTRAPSPAPTMATLNPPSCPICLDPFVGGDLLRTLRCGHELHATCVDPWLTGRSGKCPVCRADCRSPQRIAEEEAEAAAAAEAEEDGEGEATEVDAERGEAGDRATDEAQTPRGIRGLFQNLRNRLSLGTEQESDWVSRNRDISTRDRTGP